MNAAARTSAPRRTTQIPAIAELAQLDQWVAWKYVKRRDKLDKPPFNVRTHGYASHSNPDHWHSYAEAQAAKGYNGIGFVFSVYDPYTGIDYDGCRNPETGEIAAWAQTWIAQFNSYAEISPSGTGIKQIVRGTIPQALKWSIGEHTGIEVYTTQRYFCTTLQHLATTPDTIQEAQTVLDQLTQALRPEPAPKPAPKPTHALRVSPGEAGAARLSLDDARTRFNAEHTLDDLLTRYGATPTKDGYSCCCGMPHTHATTLYISRQGRLFSFSPHCKLYTTKGWDAFSLFVKLEYNDDIVAALRAINPPSSATTSRPAPPHSVETMDYTISPNEQARRAADAARKRNGRRTEAAQIRAAVEARASADTTLTDDDQLVLMVLLDAAQDRDCTRWSVARIAEVLTPAVNPKKPGTYKRRAYTALANLRDSGYITNTPQHGGTTWRTFLRVRPDAQIMDVPTDAKSIPPADAFASESGHDHESYAESEACERAPFPPAPQASADDELHIVRTDGHYHVVDQCGATHGTHTSEAAAYTHIATLYGIADDASADLTCCASYNPAEDCSQLDLAARTAIPLLPYERPASMRGVHALMPTGWTPRDDAPDVADVAAQHTLDDAPVALVPARPRRSPGAAYARKLAAMSDTQLQAELGKYTGYSLSRKFAGEPWVERNLEAIASERRKRAPAPVARDLAARGSQAHRQGRGRSARVADCVAVNLSLFADMPAPPARSTAAIYAVSQ